MPQQHHLATGIAISDGRLLVVASHYPNHPEPLWTLPGGRQVPGELLAETIVREVLEETGVHVAPRDVAYVSESYDRGQHYLNVTFVVEIVEPFAHSGSGTRVVADDGSTDHVVAVEWVPLEQVGARVTIAVVREPLLAYLRGELPQRYAGFHEAGVTIEWPPDSR